MLRRLGTDHAGGGGLGQGTPVLLDRRLGVDAMELVQVDPSRGAEYYDSQPLDLTAEYRVLETRQLAEYVLLGYLGVDFSFTDRPTLGVTLSVVLRRGADEWLITHYQVRS
ncbi:hypothetical protein ABT133_31970 [Streptomyces sp. NPDC001835]|uniref:hypothetical protein n=1 Tax=Streptomyces sp. NPDC001835 TaxID=3154528 RepID=UPI00331E5760